MIKQNTLNEIMAAADIELALIGGATTRVDGPLARLRSLLSDAVDTISDDDRDSDMPRPAYTGTAAAPSGLSRPIRGFAGRVD